MNAHKVKRKEINPEGHRHNRKRVQQNKTGFSYVPGRKYLMPVTIFFMRKAATMLPALALGLSVFSQLTPGRLMQFVSETDQIGKEEKQFYFHFNYKPAWFHEASRDNRRILMDMLDQADRLGLRKEDYCSPRTESLLRERIQPAGGEDSMDAEVRITGSAIHFFTDLAYGNRKPVFGYKGLDYAPGCFDIPALLADHITRNTLPELLTRLRSGLPETEALLERIQWLQEVKNRPGFSDITVRSSAVNAANKPLVSKLLQLGILDSAAMKGPDSLLVESVKEAQRQFDMKPDGILHSSLVRELNVPVATRLEQATLSLNYYRWISCLAAERPVILVNIPAACLKVYRESRVILEMRMILGKQSTPTPTLTSIVKEVILYPYWHVPYSIATKELLPAIKRNPGYLDAGNYQVLNKAGKVVNPYTVNWNALGASNFPYIIRQSTGCDNALGLVKLNFYNPFGVYLHDTPSKNLFKQERRFYSHGCMRMEKPMDMAHLILKNNALAIDTLEEMGCLRNQSPVVVPADEQMPVVVWYNPAGTDSTGRVLFFRDVYKKF